MCNIAGRFQALSIFWEVPACQHYGQGCQLSWQKCKLAIVRLHKKGNIIFVEYRKSCVTLTHHNMNPAKAHPFIPYSLMQAIWQTLLGTIPDLPLPHIFLAEDLFPWTTWEGFSLRYLAISCLRLHSSNYCWFLTASSKCAFYRPSLWWFWFSWHRRPRFLYLPTQQSVQCLGLRRQWATAMITTL